MTFVTFATFVGTTGPFTKHLKFISLKSLLKCWPIEVSMSVGSNGSRHLLLKLFVFMPDNLSITIFPIFLYAVSGHYILHSVNLPTLYNILIMVSFRILHGFTGVCIIEIVFAQSFQPLLKLIKITATAADLINL